MARLLIALNSLLGGVGLGLSAVYFALVAASFAPGGEHVAAFMVGPDPAQLGFGFTLIVLPYACLLLHLVGRMKVANFLVSRGEVALARSYALRRLRANLARSRREVLANRTALMRCATRVLDYEEATRVAAEALLPRPPRLGATSQEVIAFHRWRLEVALRRDDLVEAAAVVAQAWPFSATGEEAAAFHACAAEVAARSGEDYDTWVERAQFASATSERLAVTRLIVEGEPLDLATLRWLEDVPGARAELLARLGDPAAADATADARSEHHLAHREAASL